MIVRQQVLRLWLASAALDSGTVAWAFHDGCQGAGPGLPDDEPPYQTGEAALADGWFLLQTPRPLPPAADWDGQHQNADLPFEFLFERRVATS